MTIEKISDSVRDIFDRATDRASGPDKLLTEFVTSSMARMGTEAYQIDIEYRSGNEFLSLTKVLQELSVLGNVEFAEFFGRGVDPNRAFRGLSIGLNVGGSHVVIRYHIPVAG
jgi:hypothetical protein